MNYTICPEREFLFLLLCCPVLIRASEKGEYLGAMKKLFCLGAYLLASASSPVMAQTGGPDVVVVRTTDSAGYLRIVVTHGEGKSEVLELPRKDLKESPTGQEEALQKVFAKLYQEGYQLRGTGGGGGGSYYIIGLG